ncbi:hypothetical protein T10_1037 [Trichinella papuae]|uniref:Uncharacterized protein n=1 Tax=Trichinella papuae TaxID=268474 RepID=A0A0V1MND5_9BILA|nr:hypothetical protein T10_1037 [Trichinella papuae]
MCAERNDRNRSAIIEFHGPRHAKSNCEKAMGIFSPTFGLTRLIKVETRGNEGRHDYKED